MNRRHWSWVCLAAMLWPASAYAQEPATGTAEAESPSTSAAPSSADTSTSAPSTAEAPTAGAPAAPSVVPAPVAGESAPEGAAPTASDAPLLPADEATPRLGSRNLRARGVSHHDWRRSVRRGEQRESRRYRFLDPEHFAVEIRFGPYSPEVDEEFEGQTLTDSAGNEVPPPFEDYFGDKPLFYFGLEVDWLPLHVPYVGSVGAAFGWGYTSRSAKTRTVDDHDTKAESETSITIMPMHASAVVRLDGPLREWGFPLTPYAKVGVGLGLWSVSGPSGTAEVDGVVGEGTSLGTHVAVGAAVALNAFDRSQAVSLREEVGIRYAYAFGEWMYDNLDSNMHVGTSTAVFGLALDF